MKFARTTYLVAGVFGLLLMIPIAYAAIFDASDTMPGLMPAGLTFYGAILQFAACQVLLLILASNPLRFRPMMIPAFLAEVVAPLNTAWLYFYGVQPWSAVTVVFLLLAILFLVAYFRTRPQPPPIAV